ncbi:helix-turn-helix domain-containing protein [Salinimicrobium sp. HB62]|uniref:helix-turn-helix domain-containing protein n=1 Tax=Salinimicrobium sp. HB62 TaxID=3077781 RepID=UPI002D79732A|nr:AraC family transcriptional regulator [Salinimicrobium sp. HB62]
MNITFNIFLLFFSLGAIQGFILSVLILVKRQQKLYNYYFGIFLLLLSLASAKIILQETIPQFLDNFHFPLLYKFAFGPLLYLFVRELLFKSAGSFSAIFPHFVPSLIFDVFFRVSLPLFGFKNSDAAIQIFNFFGLNIGSLLYNLVYWLLAVQLLLKYRKERKGNFQLKDNRIVFHLKRILAVDLFASLSALVFIVLTLYNQNYSIGGFQSYYFNYLVITFYIYFLSYTVYIFPEVELITPKTPKVHSNKEPSEKAVFEELKKKIKENGYFTDPDLNLNRLSEKLEISPRELSYIINTEGQQNFNDFLNEFRINYFINLLQNDELSIEGMAYESGFKSKTSFYRAFKKSTGKTPLQYKASEKRVPDSVIETPEAP